MSRKNISLSQTSEQRAAELIKLRGFDGLSDLLAGLIREEYERRHPPQLSVPSPTPAASPAPPNSRKKRKARSDRALAAEGIAALERDLKKSSA